MYARWRMNKFLNSELNFASPLALRYIEVLLFVAPINIKIKSVALVLISTERFYQFCKKEPN